jgi:hypothetical protein
MELLTIIVLLIVLFCIICLALFNVGLSKEIAKYSARVEYSPDKNLALDILYDGVVSSGSKGYYYYNPSIFKSSRGGFLLLSRIGLASCPFDNPVNKSIEKMFKTTVGDENFINIDSIELPSYRKEHVKTMRSVSRICGKIYGGEDPRGFTYGGKDYALCMEYRDIGKICVPGVVLVDLETEKILSLESPVNSDKPQKNWLPLVIGDKLYIVTDTTPHRIVEPDLGTGKCRIVAETHNPFTEEYMRGSAGYIHVEDCYIGIVHYRYGLTSYSHLFYAFRDTYPFNIVAVSERFCVKVGQNSCKHKTQMLTGILLEGDTVYITGGYQDRNCFISRMSLGELLSFLNFGERRRAPPRYLPAIPQSGLVSQKIPKKIASVLILNDDILPPMSPYLIDCLNSWREKSPEYEIIILDKHDCIEFIKDNFEPDVLEAYNTLKPYAYKCDLMRICWLYVNGGVYKDIRQTLYEPLSEIIDPDAEIIFGKDLLVKRQMNYPILNSFIACIPRHAIMRKYIDLIVENVKKRRYGSSPLDVTGPNVFGYASRIFLKGANGGVSANGEWIPGRHGTCRILQFDGKIISKDDIPIIRTKPAQAEFTSDFKSGNVYSKMWDNRDIYE